MRILAHISIFAGASVIAASSALAQVAPEERAGGTVASGAGADDADGAIVVTAQRRAQRLQDIPVSVSVTTGEALQQGNLLNLESLTARLPSVRISPAPVSDFIAVRGVGSSLNFGFEQSVGTFVDGIYRSRSRSTRAAMFDVARVEVLRGPQTTFFGNNAIAGAFNITTRRPSRDFESNALAFYAPDTKEYTLEAGVSAPLTETLAVRVAGRLSGMDGYVRNDNLGTDEPHIRERIGRVSLSWRPTDTIETVARLDAGRSRNRGIFSNQLLDCPPDAAVFPGGPAGVCARYLAASGGKVDDRLDTHSVANPSFFRYDFIEGAQTTTITAGGNSLILTTGYFDHDYDMLNDVNPVPAAKGGSVTGTSGVIPAHFLEKFNQFSQEVRFQSDGHRTIEYMAGLYFAHSKLRVNGFQGLYFAPFGVVIPGGGYGPTTPIALHVFNKETADNWSLFGSATVHVSPQAKLNLGLRYSIIDKHASRVAEIGSAGSIPGFDNFVPGPEAFQKAGMPVLGVDAGDFAISGRSDNALMPSASFQYEFTPDTMGYVSYTRGFKAGGFSAYVSKSIFGPEKVDSYEAGLRTQLFDRRLTFNLTGFLANYRDLQETSTILLANGSQVQIVGNIAQSRSQGVELSASLRVFDGFTLSSDVSYLDARYKNYTSAPCTVLQSLKGSPCTQDLSGKRRAFAPEWSGNVAVDYETRLTGRYQLRLGGSMFFTSRFFMQPLADPYLAQSAYTNFDARIAFGPDDRKWEVAVIGKNLSNARSGGFRQPVSTAIGSYQAILDPDRSIGFQLTWNN